MVQASDILLDLKALQPVPDTLLAGIVGLCALDGRTGVAEEITRETGSDGKSERILTVSWLQYYIWVRFFCSVYNYVPDRI